MNVFEEIYKALFHTRSHGAVESVAKDTLNEGIYLFVYLFTYQIFKR